MANAVQEGRQGEDAVAEETTEGEEATEESVEE
jgi:hypothetical protein